MKAIKIMICVTLVVAALLYAGKTPTVFNADVEGFLKTKAAGATWTNLNGWLIFTGLDAKSQIQLTKADNDARILVNDAKQIKQKGKIAGNLGDILVGTSASSMATPTDVVYGGNAKFSVKLKGVNLGTVIAKDMKMVLVNSLNGVLAGDNAKGIKVMTQDGDLAGADSNNVAVVGLAAVPTKLKMVKAKKGKVEYVDAYQATAAKVGKTKWMAKVAGTGDVKVKAGQFDVAKSAKKNVTLTELP